MKQDQSSKQHHKVIQTPLRERALPDINSSSEQRGGKKSIFNPHAAAEKGVKRPLLAEEDTRSHPSERVESHVSSSGQTRDKKLALIGYGLIAVIAIVSLIILFYVLQNPSAGDTASSSFVEAEKLYQSQKYTEALALYLQFIRENPQHSLVPLVKERIQKINLQVIEKQNTDKLNRVNLLLAKAQQAFARKQYVDPEDDNVIGYTEEILRLIPDYPDALELKQSVIEHYQDQAQAAFRRKEYSKAAQYYEIILEIDMEDKASEKKLFETLKLIEGASQSSAPVDIDKNALQKLKNQVSVSKEAALSIAADETSAFSQALKKEAEAESKLNQQEFRDAYTLLEQAAKLFDKAIELRNRQLQNKTELAMNRMIGAKAEAERVHAPFRVPETFQKADLKAAEARELLAKKQYQDAIITFEEARKLYLSAATAAQSAS